MVRTRTLMQVHSRIDVPGRHEVLREVRPARRPLGRLVHQNGALQVLVCDRHQERVLRARVDAQKGADRERAPGDHTNILACELAFRYPTSLTADWSPDLFACVLS